MAEDPAAAVVERLAAGLAVIAPLLEEHGFKLVGRDHGKGSGGYLASADFAKDDRRRHRPGGGNRFPSYSELAGSGDEYVRCANAVDDEQHLSGPQRLARIERRLRER